MIRVPFADKTLVMSHIEARDLIRALQCELGDTPTSNVFPPETEHQKLRRLGVIGPGKVRTGGGGFREMTSWERDMWERGYEITGR